MAGPPSSSSGPGRAPGRGSRPGGGRTLRVHAEHIPLEGPVPGTTVASRLTAAGSRAWRCECEESGVGSVAAGRSRRRGIGTTIGGGLVVTAVLAYLLADRRDEFATALTAASVWILVLATVLQLLALVSRTEAWRICVAAAGGTVGRRCLFRAASTGYVGSQLNSQIGTAVRIGALRRAAPDRCPRVPALIAAEVPILTVEAVLAALTSFTLVGPLGLPWGVPLACLGLALALVIGMRALAGRRDRPCWSGLAVLRRMNGRSWVIVLVLLAVFAQILRNWLVLHALGVDASLLDAVAVLIAMVTMSQLPFGPSVGAVSVVAILGSGGVAIAAAAGVLLTATGTVGALAFGAWAVVDRLVDWRASHGAAPAVLPAPAISLDAVVPAA